MRSNLMYVTVASLCLILTAIVFAQDEVVSDYDPITPDNVDNMIEIAAFTCEGDTHHAASAFYEDIFAYACFQHNGSAPIITAVSLQTGDVLWEQETSGYMRDFELLPDDLVLLDLQSRAEIYHIGNPEPLFSQEFINVTDLALSPDRVYVGFITGDFDASMVQVYRLPEMELIEQEFAISGNMLQTISLSSNGLLAMTDNRGVIYIYDIETGNLVRETSPGEQQIHADFEGGGSSTSSDYHHYSRMIFSPTNDRVITTECTFIQMGCWSNGLTLFDVETGKVIGLSGNDHEIYEFTGFTGDNYLLAVGSCGQFLELVTLDDLTVTSIPPESDGHCQPESVSVSDDGRLISFYDYSESESHYRIYGIPASE